MARSAYTLPDIEQFKIIASTINHKNEKGLKLNNKEIKAFVETMLPNFHAKKQPIVQEYVKNITSAGLTSNTSHTIKAYIEIYKNAHTKDTISPNLISDLAKTDCKQFLMKGMVDPNNKELHSTFNEMQKTIDNQDKQIVDLKSELKIVMERNTSLKHEVNSLKVQNQTLQSSGNEQKQEIKRSQGRKLD